MRAFLGLANYYRRFVERFATIAAPLNELTGDAPFQWLPHHQAAFDALKAALTSNPLIIHAPNPTLPYTLKCDASTVGIGSVLTQGQDKEEQVIAYHSRKLTPAERNYPVHEQEMLSLIESLKVWRHYLLGSKTHVRTDNRPNKYLQTKPYLDPKRQARWMETLQEYDVEIEHIPGKDNVVADALSRRPDYFITSLSLILNTISEAKVADDISGEVRNSAPDDPEYQRLYKAAAARRLAGYKVQDGLLYFQPRNGQARRLCVPAGPVRLKLMQEAHDCPLSGHLGAAKTLQRLQRFYHWPNIGASVDAYVRTCTQCSPYLCLSVNGNRFPWI